jgi:hypothetical protein
MAGPFLHGGLNADAQWTRNAHPPATAVALWRSSRRKAYAAVGLHSGVSAFVNEHVEGMDSYFSNTSVLSDSLREMAGLFLDGGHHADATKAMLARSMLVEESSLLSHTERFVLAGPTVKLMQEALADDAITAWVAPNENTALACLDYLKQQGVRTPGEIAMVGHEDIAEAFDAGLTSYNFNLEAAVDAFVGTILGRQFGEQTKTGRNVEIEGYIVERKSTACVRTA